MGKLISPPELTLDFKPTFIPKTITHFLGEMSRIGTESEKIAKLEDLVCRFESEVRKIDAFKRELPLCMLLMNDAIAALKEELMAFKNSANQPVLEEFIPLKKTCEEDPQVEIDRIDQTDKRNWLSSTQLWNPIDSTSENTNQHHNPKQNSMEQVIQKIAKEEQNRRINDPCYVNSGLSLVTPGIKKLGGDHGHKLASYGVPDGKSDIRIGPPQPRSEPSHQQTCRKQRRCWSTELHRRFVNALQQLGGSKAATPKQIRELMRVDGLTNDEVKSHLQKYRLHTKRLSSSNSSNVVSGGLWVPHHDQYVEMNMNAAESGSPDGPLLNCATGGTSTTGGDSMDDGEDERSENNCWKTHPHTSGKNYV